MNAFHKWLSGVVWTCGVWVSYEWLDRPIVLFFQQMVGRPELLAKLAQVPDLFVPLTVTAVLPHAVTPGNLRPAMQSKPGHCGYNKVAVEIRLWSHLAQHMGQRQPIILARWCLWI